VLPPPPEGAPRAGHLVLMASLGLMMTPLLTEGLSVLPEHLYSHGSAILTTLQQVAGAAGTAGFVSIAAIRGTAAPGSPDVRPGHFVAVAKNLYENGRRTFALGIAHELALPVELDPDVRPKGASSMRGYSVGGFGSVTTNKVIATVVAETLKKLKLRYPPGSPALANLPVE